MSDRPPPRGRPANDQPRYRRHYISLPADVSDWLMRQPSGERSRLIADLLRQEMVRLSVRSEAQVAVPKERKGAESDR